MLIKRYLLSSFGAMAFLTINAVGAVHAAPLMIVGNDEKILWDDNGKPVLSPAGKDSVLIVDLADPENPTIIANLPLKNSVVGPPVNLDIDPTNSIALVADSIDVTKDGEVLKQGPDDKIYVIDLKASPPKLINTITGAKQPSGLSISPLGNLALVANRADKSITVLSIQGTEVKVTDTIPMGDEVSHVTFAGWQARIGDQVLRSQGVRARVACDKVSYNKFDLPAGCGRTTSRWRPMARCLDLGQWRRWLVRR